MVRCSSFSRIAIQLQLIPYQSSLLSEHSTFKLIVVVEERVGVVFVV